MDKTDRLRDYGLAFLLYEQGLGLCGYELIRELFIFVKLILNSYLRLIFNSDMTFSLSFSVPFMADTVGTWKVGGMNEWNEIVYHNDIIDQFGKFDDGDTIIYINSPTPQKTYKKPTLIDKVFFVRIK